MEREMVDWREGLPLEKIIDHFIDYGRKPKSYVRAYYYWKKFQNISYLFSKEVEGQDKPIHVIDIGCGFGSNIIYLNWMHENKEIEFHGVDLNPSKIYFCNLKKEKYQVDNIKFIIGDAENLKFPKNKYDILLSVELLEHLRNPIHAVMQFYRILKPNGVAIITTPNITNPVSKLKRLFSLKLPEMESEVVESMGFPCGDSLGEIGYGHISVKSLSEWIRIFRECGFKIERIKRGGILFGTPGQDKHRVLFALILLAEFLLDKANVWWNLSEDVTVSLRKVS